MDQALPQAETAYRQNITMPPKRIALVWNQNSDMATLRYAIDICFEQQALLDLLIFGKNTGYSFAEIQNLVPARLSVQQFHFSDQEIDQLVDHVNRQSSYLYLVAASDDSLVYDLMHNRKSILRVSVPLVFLEKAENPTVAEINNI